uniref:glutaminase n=1 Tax=Parascaris univalens TaxID=6257 RepID=A0A915A2P0_PARUN
RWLCKMCCLCKSFFEFVVGARGLPALMWRQLATALGCRSLRFGALREHGKLNTWSQGCRCIMLHGRNIDWRNDSRTVHEVAVSPMSSSGRNTVVMELLQLPNKMSVTGSVVARALSSDSMANYSTRVTGGTMDVIFDLYRNRDTETLSVHELLKSLHKCGIREDDPRLNSFIRAVADEERRQFLPDLPPSESTAANLDRDAFKRCVSGSIGIIAKALKKHLVVPDWSTFVAVVTEIFESCRKINDGKVHGYVGQEPSGRLFNEICLNHNKKPHNPMINAGAILVVSLLKRNNSLSDRFDFALQQLKNFACNGYVGFNNAVFLSERETADRNYALSYYMREHKCFPRNTSLQDTLDLYFQLCSIETNTDTLAVMAATLANGGVSPLGAKRVVCNRAVRDTLSLMYSCGMYDYSGQFAFTVGLPAKSGVSGDLMIVVPNVMGIGIYSPPLDSLGNTVRGVKFAKQLVEKFNFHNYDSVVSCPIVLFNVHVE